MFVYLAKILCQLHSTSIKPLHIDIQAHSSVFYEHVCSHPLTVFLILETCPLFFLLSSYLALLAHIFNFFIMEPNFITKETIFVLVVQVSFDIRFLGLSIGFHLDLPGVVRNSILSPRAIFKKLLAKIDCTIKITEMSECF